MTEGPRRLLFLGAGPNQVPAIETAVALGYEVTTVDNRPDNPGHERSHRYEPCSTTHEDEVLEIARRLRVDGVMTFASDVAVPTVAHVARACGLPGAWPREVDVLSTKSGLRSLQRRVGLPAPDHAAIESEAELRALDLSGTLVFKPEDASGSKGISSASYGDLQAMRAAWRWARSSSRSGKVCVEQLCAGEHLSAEGYIEDGRVLHVACTQKVLDGFLVRGHVVPASFAPGVVASLKRQIERIAGHVELKHAFFDLDAVVTDRGPVIIEMSPRLGGNGIPLLLKYALGLDLLRGAVRFAMGDPFDLRSSAEPRRMGSWVFGAPCEGVLSALTDPSTLLTDEPRVRHVLMARCIGDRVRPMIDSSDLLGYVVFDLAPDADFGGMVAQIHPHLGIVVHDGV